MFIKTIFALFIVFSCDEGFAASRRSADVSEGGDAPILAVSSPSSSSPSTSHEEAPATTGGAGAAALEDFDDVCYSTYPPSDLKLVWMSRPRDPASLVKISDTTAIEWSSPHIHHTVYSADALVTAISRQVDRDFDKQQMEAAYCRAVDELRKNGSLELFDAPRSLNIEEKVIWLFGHAAYHRGCAMSIVKGALRGDAGLLAEAFTRLRAAGPKHHAALRKLINEVVDLKKDKQPAIIWKGDRLSLKSDVKKVLCTHMPERFRDGKRKPEAESRS